MPPDQTDNVWVPPGWPWGISRQPAPVPAKTRTRAYGYGVPGSRERVRDGFRGLAGTSRSGNHSHSDNGLIDIVTNVIVLQANGTSTTSSSQHERPTGLGVVDLGMGRSVA